jgi:hypothetical protein
LSADCLYEDTWKLLVELVPALLRAAPPGAEVWMVNTNRVAVHRFHRRLRNDPTVEIVEAGCERCIGHASTHADIAWRIRRPQLLSTAPALLHSDEH